MFIEVSLCAFCSAAVFLICGALYEIPSVVHILPLQLEDIRLCEIVFYLCNLVLGVFNVLCFLWWAQVVRCGCYLLLHLFGGKQVQICNAFHITIMLHFATQKYEINVTLNYVVHTYSSIILSHVTHNSWVTNSCEQWEKSQVFVALPTMCETECSYYDFNARFVFSAWFVVKKEETLSSARKSVSDLQASHGVPDG